jgi:hypothetical protein
MSVVSPHRQVTISDVELGDERSLERTAWNGTTKTNQNTLVLGGIVKKIGECAFEGNYLITTVSVLTEMEVGDYAFNFCRNLRTLTSRAAVSIGKNAFKNTGLKSVTLPAAAPAPAATPAAAP